MASKFLDTNNIFSKFVDSSDAIYLKYQKIINYTEQNIHIILTICFLQITTEDT